MKLTFRASAMSVIAGVMSVSACDEPRSMTVEPSTDLTDGQSVAVKLRGYVPGTQELVSQCTSNDGDACGPSALVDIGPDGTGRVTIRLWERLAVSYFDPNTRNSAELDFDCRYKASCALTAGSLPASQWVPLRFRNEIVPQLNAAPTANLPARANVNVAGSALPVNVPIVINQCVVGGGLCERLGWFWTDASGGLSAQVSVQLLMEFAACDSPGKCELRAQLDEHVVFGRFPLSFAGGLLEWSATPTVDLAAAQNITVSGTGFGAKGSYVQVYQCPANSAGTDGCSALDSAPVLEDGSFSRVVRVNQARPVTCAAPGDCALVIRVDNQLVPRKVPLAFKPVGPIVTGALQLASQPIAGTPVQLLGSHWASNTAVNLFCAGTPFCLGSYDPVIANGNGTFSGALTPRTFVEGGRIFTGTGTVLLAGLFDCTMVGNCSFNARDFRGGDAVTIPVVVHPSTATIGTAHIPSPIPVEGATPMSVILRGGGWEAARELVAYQCSTTKSLCVLLAFFNTDATGAFDVPAHLELGASGRPPYAPPDSWFSCTEQANSCEVIVTYNDGRAALEASPHIPLEFRTTPQP